MLSLFLMQFEFLFSFLAAICISTLIFFGFSGGMSFSKKFFFRDFLITYYFWFILYILLVCVINLFIKVNLSLILAIFGVFYLIGLINNFKYIQKYKIKNINITYFVLFLFSTIICFLLWKIIYLGGLHDDYFHQAVLSHFFSNKNLPFIHPYIFGENLKFSYHYGLYLLVIPIKIIFNRSIENSLDIAKITIILPSFPLIFIQLKEILEKKNPIILLIVISIFLLGPSCFLHDSFTKLLKSQESVQIYTPNLYELAGITWSGMVFYLIFTLELIILIKNKIKINQLIGLATIFLGMFFINQAFFLLFIFNSIIIVALNWFRVKKIVKNNYFILFILLLGLTITLLINRNFYSYLEKILAFEFIKNKQSLGWVYAESLSSSISTNHAYLKLSDQRILASLGLIPLLILAMLFKFDKNEKSLAKNLISISLINIYLLPLIVYFIQDQPYYLAFNKLYRPAFIFIPIVYLYFFNKFKNKFIRLFLLIILSAGLISPFKFFILSDARNIQNYWSNLNEKQKEILVFLNSNPQYQNILVENPEDQYFIANNGKQRACSKDVCKINQANLLLLVRGYEIEYDNFNKPIFNNGFYQLISR